MATLLPVRNRVGKAPSRAVVTAPVASPAAEPPVRARQVDDRIAVLDSAPKEAPLAAELPSLLEEAETLAKSFEALQSNNAGFRQEGSQARAARRYFYSPCWLERTNRPVL